MSSLVCRHIESHVSPELLCKCPRSCLEERLLHAIITSVENVNGDELSYRDKATIDLLIELICHLYAARVDWPRLLLLTTDLASLGDSYNACKTSFGSPTLSKNLCILYFDACHHLTCNFHKAGLMDLFVSSEKAKQILPMLKLDQSSDRWGFSMTYKCASSSCFLAESFSLMS